MIIYSDMQHIPSVFLAGPTPRNDKTQSWRPEAIRLFKHYKFPGNLMVPERTDWNTKFDYMDQVNWEWEGMERADIVMFWVPSDPDEMLALTTRVEFGYCLGQKKRVLYGRPDGSFKTDYLDALYKKVYGNDAPIYNSLSDLIFETRHSEFSNIINKKD
jgi:nucleoside 2-deoxyribosyltransferase